MCRSAAACCIALSASVSEPFGETAPVMVTCRCRLMRSIEVGLVPGSNRTTFESSIVPPFDDGTVNRLSRSVFCRYWFSAISTTSYWSEPSL